MDTEEAVKEFESALSAFDVSGLAEEMGVPKNMVEVRLPCGPPTLSRGGRDEVT